MLPRIISTREPGSGKLDPGGFKLIRKSRFAIDAIEPAWLSDANELSMETEILVASWPAGRVIGIPIPKLHGCATPGLATKLKPTLALLAGKLNGTTGRPFTCVTVT